MPWAVAGGTLSAIGSIAGASIGSSAASGSAKQQQTALAQAATAQGQGFNEAQNYLDPYYQTGLQDQSLYNSILTGTPISQQAGFNQAFGGPTPGDYSSYLPSNVTNAIKSFTSKSPNLEYPDGSDAFVNHTVGLVAKDSPSQYQSWLQSLGLPSTTPQSDFTNAIAGTGGATQPLTGDFALANQSPSSSQYSAFFNSPDYQFALQQGLQGVNNSASAKGQLDSGAQQIGLTQYAQGLASQQYNSFMSKLQGQATSGQQAGGALANAALGQGSALAGLTAQSGNAAAAGTVGSANSLTSALNNLTGSAGIGAAGGGAGVLGNALSSLLGGSDLTNSQTIAGSTN